MNGTVSPSPHLNVPLPRVAHNLARQFAAEQATSAKGMRVYLNTLAVWAVHRYLNWLQIEVDLSAGKSWQPAMRALFDVADLVLPNLGKLECRPVLPGETILTLPPEVTQNRIGYLPVQFSDRLEEVQLLGFVSAVALEDSPEQLQLTELQPLEVLLEQLDQLLANPSLPKTPVNLSRWLQNIFETGWQTVEEVFASPIPALAFRRSSLRRAKLIELVTNQASYSLALLVTLKSQEDNQLGILLQIYQAEQARELPPHLKLIVLTANGDVFREITATETDTFIQYEFSGQPGENFSVQVVLGEISFTETFVI
ncbi:MAG: DUF1822 family protein [Coleofasciculaceae cyanobacterium]